MVLESKCIKCEEKSVSNNLCRKHLTEANIARWLDNSDFSDDTKGIRAWSRECLPDYTPQLTPDIHVKLYQLLLELYDPVLINKYERLRNVIMYRGSGKSTTANFILPLYVLCHNGQNIKFRGKLFKIEERYVLICSETGTMAEDFVVRLRDEFGENQFLKYYYKFTIQDVAEDDTGQWTRRAFKFNGCYIVGKGSGQQIRGTIKGASRVTLAILDDIYSENNVITEERRISIKKWFYNGMFKTIDDLKGKCVVLGTIVHDDTILVDLEKNSLWVTHKFSLMPIEKFHKLINNHCEIEWDINKCKLPFDDMEDKALMRDKQREYFDNLQAQEDWGLAWKERQTLYSTMLMYKEAVQNQSVSGFYQEYFHITVSPSERKFRSSYFQKAEVELEYRYGYNWIKISGFDWQVCNIEFGVDTSAGTLKGDNTVITIVATTADNRRYILLQRVGKWSLRDNVKEGVNKFDLVCMDYSYITNIGFVDELFRLSRRFHPSVIKIGVAGEEKLNFEEIRRVFRINGDYTIQINKRIQGARDGNKFERIISTCLGYYESKQVYHCFDSKDLEYELEYLSKAKNDDRADSLEVSFFQMNLPHEIDQKFFGSPEIINKKKTLKDFLPDLKSKANFEKDLNNWRVN